MVVCHVTAGLQFCPNPPAFPAPEYWIEFTSPMAFCAFWMTVFASCADAIPAPSASNNTSIIHILLAIIPPAVVLRELLYLGLGVRAHYTTVGRLAHALRIGYTGPFKFVTCALSAATAQMFSNVWCPREDSNLHVLANTRP